MKAAISTHPSAGPIGGRTHRREPVHHHRLPDVGRRPLLVVGELGPSGVRLLHVHHAHDHRLWRLRARKLVPRSLRRPHGCHEDAGDGALLLVWSVDATC